MRHFRPAQIEVAILQPQFLVHLAGRVWIVHRERQHVGGVEHLKRLGDDFDLAGGNLGIGRSRRTQPHQAGDGHDTFAA